METGRGREELATFDHSCIMHIKDEVYTYIDFVTGYIPRFLYCSCGYCLSILIAKFGAAFICAIVHSMLLVVFMISHIIS